ncbi:CDP-glycerol glycerophosphotransferase family protein [Arthrobacter rhombi]|uniref:CDP-glycerol glycerophosphotransferase family protein n=1 Tax=Arthrobacter rhombi TaxID=71253 RepID=UPI003FCFFB7D
MTNATAVSRMLGASLLPIVFCSGSASVEAFVDKHQVMVIFYVNNNQANFTTLRINGPLHVHLSHGESEKSSMVSNQLKAYDVAFIAGPASRTRILKHVHRMDPAHLLEIGRPQLDNGATPTRSSDSPPIVLYAPTWEGDSAEMAYSSLTTSGLKLAHFLHDDPRITFIFRPHPKTGTKSRAHGRAMREVRLLTKESQTIRGGKALPSSPRTAMADISRADVVVTDISAMAMDAIGLNKPTVILSNSTNPSSAPPAGLTDSVPTWPAVPEDPVDELLRYAHGGATPRQAAFRDHVFGQATLGTGTERFIDAAHELLKSSRE